MSSSARRSEKVRALPSCAELDRKLEIENRHLHNEELKAGMRHKGDHVFLISKIVDYDIERGYLCHWKGYSDKERTWERSKTLNTSKDLRKMMKEAREKKAAQ
jgi:hypothetical protein